MKTAVFAFPGDLEDEGDDRVLERLRERAGVDGLVLAAAYHAARDLLPHNPRGRVRFLEPGVVHFRPHPARWAGARLVPRPSALAATRDPLREAVAAARDRGLAAHGWMVLLHTDRLGFEHPECAPRNAFGDPYPTDLCPSNPDVRRYAATLAAEVAACAVESVVAESLHFHPWEHGYHHERAFVALSDRARLLLGLCFCDSCRAAAAGRGVDAEAARRAARAELERALEGDAADEPADSLRAEGGPLGAYVAARVPTVTSLVADVARAVQEEGSRLTVLDLSGAVKGYASGEPEGGPAAWSAWRLGLDPREVVGAGAALDVLAYARDPERVRADLAAYRELLGRGADLGVVLRPMAPDCDGPENLRAKVEVARAAGAERAGFYHYGLMPLRCLDWIAGAIRPLRRTSGSLP
jgi:hypothetical protein